MEEACSFLKILNRKLPPLLAMGKSEVVHFASYAQRLEIIKTKLDVKISRAEIMGSIFVSI